MKVLKLQKKTYKEKVNRSEHIHVVNLFIKKKSHI